MPESARIDPARMGICPDDPQYRVVTPWWAGWLIRCGEWLIACGERGRWLEPVPPEG